MTQSNVFDVQRFCRNVIRLSQTDSAQALWAISRLVLEVISRQSSVGWVFSSRELDICALKIGAELTSEIVRPSSYSNRIVYLLTQVGESGGHGRVLRDLISAEPEGEKTLILSHVFPANSSEYDLISRSGVQVEVVPELNMAEKVRWIACRLSDLAPRKTYMMLHQFDSVLVAAAQPLLTGQLIYIHNCDHALSLGVHIPHAHHADFHVKGWFRCRCEIGRPGYRIPLTAADLGRRSGRFMARGFVTTCTSGGFEKFSNSHYIERRMYLYQYADMVAVALNASRGMHVHIGPLPDDLISCIRSKICEIGLPQDRFRHFRSAPTVWEVLLQEKIDVYLGSIPYGGGRATVEAMGAGMPLIIHSNYRSEFLSVEFEVYKGAMTWRTFEELSDHIRGLTPDLLERQGALSRAYYQGHHASELLLQALSRIDQGLPELEPEPYQWQGDALQDFLDGGLSGRPEPMPDETLAVWRLGAGGETQKP